MPNSERVLNIKVQVLIKIAPPILVPTLKIYARYLRESPSYKKILDLFKRESYYHFDPSGVENGKTNLK